MIIIVFANNSWHSSELGNQEQQMVEEQNHIQMVAGYLLNTTKLMYVVCVAISSSLVCCKNVIAAKQQLHPDVSTV